MTDLSLNEVETLAAKAARGSGLSWGLADDVAKAARRLACAGLNWTDRCSGWPKTHIRPQLAQRWLI